MGEKRISAITAIKRMRRMICVLYLFMLRPLSPDCVLSLTVYLCAGDHAKVMMRNPWTHPPGYFRERLSPGGIGIPVFENDEFVIQGKTLFDFG
jgi:hypothetical protein